METSTKSAYIQHEPMHEELKWRAYHFFEQKQTETSGTTLNDELKDELPRIAYALSLVQECGDADMSNDRAYRAARIYLRALGSFVAVRGTNRGTTNRRVRGNEGRIMMGSSVLPSSR
jgi:hypothetical protein